MNFLHVGYGKGGSSFLQKYYFIKDNGFLNLARHPDWRAFIQDGLLTAQSIYFPSINCPPIPRQDGQNPLCIGVSEELFLGDGVDYRVKLERWKAIFPETSVLIVTRNQLDIVYSGYCSHVPDGYYRSINRYLRELIWDAQATYFGSLFFDRAYEITKEYFDRVLVLPYELMSSSDLFFEEINQFFDVTGRVPSLRVNASANDTVLLVMRILNFLFRHGRARPQMTILPSYIIGSSRFDLNQVPGKEPSPVFRKQLNKIATKIGRNIPIDRKTRQAFHNTHYHLFEEWFGESNRRLQKMINRDLSPYGYVGTIDRGNPQ